jgi:hypothetical protein
MYLRLVPDRPGLPTTKSSGSIPVPPAMLEERKGRKTPQDSILRRSAPPERRPPRMKSEYHIRNQSEA